MCRRPPVSAFVEALEHALVADLEPGDAIFIPSLWWHNIAASGPLCVLLNYWWGANDETAAFPVLAHALLSLRDVAPGERAAWAVWFEHYIFGEDAAAVADHLPPHARGVLGPPSPQRTAKMKDYLLRGIDRS